MDKDLREPAVTVLMPVYNCRGFVEAAVNSILSQTFSDLEFLIIDDCSDDGTLQLLQGYKDPRIRLLTKKKRTGLIASLNIGLEQARAPFTARMDGDDISHPDRIERQVDYLRRNPDVLLCGTWYELMPTLEVVAYPAKPDEVRASLLDYCPIGHPTVMFRTAFMKTHALNYDPQFRAAEDYDLWTRVTALGKMTNLPEVLLSYRMHPGQVSVTEQQLQAANTTRCKERMICYLIQAPSEADKANARTIAENSYPKSEAQLRELVQWLDHIQYENDQSGFYAADFFIKYIERKKAAVVRSFYLHQTGYNLGVLSRFRGSYLRYFSVGEVMRFLLKCALHWK